MTGPLDSVIGVQKEKVLGSFLTGMAARFDVAKRDVHLQGVILDVDEETGRSRTIERVDMKLGD
jgi:calcineurin-like phosphoesterase